MMFRPILRRQCVPWLCGLGLLGLVLQLRHVQGQSPPQQESAVCTIEPLFVLVGSENDAFGYDTSLSLNGSIAAIGAPAYFNNDSGFIYGRDGYVQAFRFEKNAWTQLGSTIFGKVSETSSNALSDDGSVLAVGGYYSRDVRVFRLVDDDWEPLGNNITYPREYIGYALALSGDGTILAASSPNANNDAGEVLVFELVGDTWSQKGRTLEGQGKEEYFGQSISLSQDGSVLAVGIPDYGNGETNGFVRVFDFIANDWVQIGQTLEGANVGDSFGNDVSLSSDGQTLAVGAPLFDGNFNDSGSVHVYRYGSDGQWFEPGAVLIGEFPDDQFGRSLALSGDASILIASGVVLLRFFVANGKEWIEVGEETTNSTDWNDAAISRDGLTALGGANVFDISCSHRTPSPVPSPPATATTTNPSKNNSIGIIIGAFIGVAIFLAIAFLVGIRMKKLKEDAAESVKGTPSESHAQPSVQRSNAPVVSYDQSLPSAPGLVVYDECGEVLVPRTVAAQAILVERDNSTTLQNNSTKVQAPSAGSLKPSVSRQVIETPLPDPMAVSSPSDSFSSPSDSYRVQFKDQARTVIETPVPEPMVVSSPSNGYPVLFKDQARTVRETPVPEPMVAPSPSNGYPVQINDQARTVLQTPVPEPMLVTSPSDGYPVQFKDQARSVAAPQRRVALDP